MPSSSHLQSRQYAFVTRVNVSTGGGRGLGLCMAEGLVEAGGKVHCLDRLPEPPQAFQEAQGRLKSNIGASLQYHRVDVTDEQAMRKCIGGIASEHQRLDGLIAGTEIPIHVGNHILIIPLQLPASSKSHPRSISRRKTSQRCSMSTTLACS